MSLQKFFLQPSLNQASALESLCVSSDHLPFVLLSITLSASGHIRLIRSPLVRSQAIKLHPDKLRAPTADDFQRARDLPTARLVIGDPLARAEYIAFNVRFASFGILR